MFRERGVAAVPQDKVGQRMFKRFVFVDASNHLINQCGDNVYLIASLSAVGIATWAQDKTSFKGRNNLNEQADREHTEQKLTLVYGHDSIS